MATDEQVAMLLECMGAGKEFEDKARYLLKKTNYDLNEAAGQFYDVGGVEEDPPSWNETLHEGDRYGNLDQSSIPSFNIDFAPGVDHYPHSTVGTRPNSRTSHRSEPNPDIPIPSTESRPMFGPATHPESETKNWALTTVSRVEDEPLPSQRQRGEQAPTFLKPHENAEYLPALLSTLSSVPIARNTLLAPEVNRHHNYRVGDDWWKGTGHSGGVYVGGIKEEQDQDLLYEAQRLMAFLEATTRAYGSTGALQELPAWKHLDNMEESRDSVLRFLDLWERAYTSVTSNSLDGILKSVLVTNEGEEHKSFYLQVPVESSQTDAEKTLYDVLDDHILSSLDQRALYRKPANVLIFALKSDAAELQCKVPAELNVARYLEENKAEVDAMLGALKALQDKLDGKTKQLDKVKFHTTIKTRPGEKVDALALLRTAMLAFKPNKDGTFADPKHADSLDKLQKIYEKVELKIRKMEKEIKHLKEELERIRGGYRAPFGPSTSTDHATDEIMVNTESSYSELESHKHHYELAGVSTRPSVTYLKHPDIDGQNQWYRMEYCQDDNSRAFVMIDQMPLETVLEKAGSEHSSALLVYANKAAYSATPVPLSQKLIDFVNADNAKFEEELTQEKKTGGWENYDVQHGPVQATGNWNEGDAANTDWAPEHQNPPWDAPAGYQFGDESGYQKPVEAKQGYYEQPYQQQQQDEDQSSFTLTPNTGMGDEMQESGVAKSGMSGSDVIMGSDAPDLLSADTSDEYKIKGAAERAAGAGAEERKYASNNPYNNFTSRGG